MDYIKFTVVLDGKILIIDGSDSPSGPSVGTAILSVDVYDPATDSWSQKGSIPERVGAGFNSIVNGNCRAGNKIMVYQITALEYEEKLIP